MRYLIVNQFALPPYQPGGTRHYLIAKRLTELGHQVHIVASNLHYSSRELFETTGKSEVIDGITFHWLKTIPYKNGITRLINHFQFLILILFCFRRTAVKYEPDIIIGSSPQPFAVFGAWILSKLTGAHFWYEVRDLWPESLVHLNVISKKNPLYYCFAFIERFASNKAEKIFCLMPGGLDYFIDRGLQANKLLWAPNGLDFNIQTNFLKCKKSDDNFLEIAYFGSHGPSDGLDFVIDVAEKLKKSNIRFRLVGNGPVKNHLKARTKSNNIDNVIFDEPVPKSEIYKVMATADVCLALALPSPLYKWGISFNKIFDYFYMKKPIIFIGDVAFNPIADADAGIVIKNFDVSEAASMILKMAILSNDELTRLGTNGFSYGKRHHSIDEIVKKFEPF